MFSRIRSVRRLAHRRNRVLNLFLEGLEIANGPGGVHRVSSAAALQSDINTAGQSGGNNLIELSGSFALG